MVYQSIGTDATAASDQLSIRETNRLIRHKAKLAGVAVADDKESDGTRRTIKKAVDDFVARAIKKRKLVAAHCYRTSLDLFQQATQDHLYLDQITEDTLLDFHDYLRKRGNSERTISNRHGHVKSLLLWCGWHREEMKKKIGEPPTYDTKVVVPYRRDELSTLFASCEDDRYFGTVLKLLHMAGLRDAEGTHLKWADIDFKREQIKVSAKPDLGFRLKDREERIIPMPPELVRVLKERRKVCPVKHRLVVGTADDKPHTKWLRLLKRAAREAQLECGHCDGCREMTRTGKRTVDRGCEHWTLHNFRRTYATALDEAGFSLKQIMDLLGHSDIETTMRYLGNQSRKDNRQRMAKVNW